MKQKTENNPVPVLVEANPTFTKSIPENEPYLEISEFFGPTLQGEGINIGVPAFFLRVKHCFLGCHFCDTASVWRHGNPYTFNEIFELMEKHDVINKLKQDQHLILTGGSPLKQQDKIIHLFQEFEDRYGFIPYIEVENECVALPKPEFEDLIYVWNNSPKLRNSGNPDILRYRPEVLKHVSDLENSWFKFVIDGTSWESAEKDWQEIKEDFLDKGLIYYNQIILMPLGESQKELNESREITAQLAIRENVRFTDRLHITIWDQKVSV